LDAGQYIKQIYQRLHHSVFFHTIIALYYPIPLLKLVVCLVVLEPTAASYEPDDETYQHNSGYAIKDRGICLNILPALS
jgi:hypothetical protein